MNLINLIIYHLFYDEVMIVRIWMPSAISYEIWSIRSLTYSGVWSGLILHKAVSKSGWDYSESFGINRDAQYSKPFQFCLDGFSLVIDFKKSKIIPEIWSGPIPD